MEVFLGEDFELWLEEEDQRALQVNIPKQLVRYSQLCNFPSISDLHQVGEGDPDETQSQVADVPSTSSEPAPRNVPRRAAVRQPPKVQDMISCIPVCLIIERKLNSKHSKKTYPPFF